MSPPEVVADVAQDPGQGVTFRGARPGGRSARVRGAVHTAVLEMLAEHGGEGLTIQAIADRAGVHSTTLYRRWRTTADVLADVASSRFSGPDSGIVVPDTGDLRTDLQQWAAAVAADLADPDVSVLMRAAIGAGEGGGCLCRGDRIEQLTAIIDRERERGGPPIDVEHAADVLLAPLYYRVTFTETPGTPEWARSLVDTLL
jgi:AcrR family transcriptional regulator